MNKKFKTRRKNNLFNFRVDSEEKLAELKSRSKNLRTKELSQADIFEDGLLVNEGKDEERTVLNKKQPKKAIRNEALEKLIETNAIIRAYNLRLKDLNPSRYRHLTEDEGTLELYDKNGKRIV